MISISNFPPHPEWMTEEGLKLVSGGYLLPGTTVKDTYARVAQSAQKWLPEVTGLDDDIFEILWNGWLGLASPVFSNFGTNRGLPISCYANHLEDSVNGIYSQLKSSAQIAKNGGGCATYFGDVRPSGSPITGGGKSSSVLGWMKQFDLQAAVVNQGGVRRGNSALYLPIDHPDLPEVLRAKDHSQGDPRNFIDSNIAVTIQGQWMEEMVSGDLDKIRLFGNVIECGIKTGSPYILFIDNVNKANPDCYKERGLEVTTSNLCFSGETLVAVADGRNSVSIKELAETGQKVPVYSARPDKRGRGEWVTEINLATPFKNGVKKVVEVTLEDRSSFKCTPDHKLALAGEISYIEAKDSVGRSLEPFTRRSGQKVISVKEFGVEDVYDLTVENNHNFFIVTNESEELSTGVLVHNCVEMSLFTDKDHTLVCVLSSLNANLWDEWKDYRGERTGLSAPELGIYLLEAVTSEFLHKAKRVPSLGRAIRFCKKSRSLGLGSMGLAALYQSKNLPFKSQGARALNIQVHKFINIEAEKASRRLAAIYGEPEWLSGTGLRHSHRTAGAPTRSNSVICNSISPSGEPSDSNYYSASEAKGTFTRKNPYLAKLLQSKGYDTPEVWDSILDNLGSVSHLSFLSNREKEIFLTFRETSQWEIVKQTADRQKHVDQGISMNIALTGRETAQELLELHIYMWQSGLKSRYYLRSQSSQKVAKVKPQDYYYVITKDGCPYCEAAEALLDSTGEFFTLISKNDSESLDSLEFALVEYPTYPQIYRAGNFIGGYSELYQKLYEEGGYMGNQEGCSSCEG